MARGSWWDVDGAEVGWLLAIGGRIVGDDRVADGWVGGWSSSN